MLLENQQNISEHRLGKIVVLSLLANTKGHSKNYSFQYDPL